jgi:hypothetical protein
MKKICNLVKKKRGEIEIYDRQEYYTVSFWLVIVSKFAFDRNIYMYDIGFSTKD